MKQKMAAKKTNAQMSVEQARSLIIKPYITEKTFNMIERENTLTFIVAERATKNQIKEALAMLYESQVIEVNTSRTSQGKKAHMKFKEPEGARNLATTLGLV
jgi:large subunit ribosomal protein L23